MPPPARGCLSKRGGGRRNTVPAALECQSPKAAYLRAVAAARKGDAAGVKKNLADASKCEDLAARATKDIEFAQYR